jgi:pilus assembly protein Flp/PilA
MTKLYAKLQSRMVRSERGATAVEYGLMVALIAGVIIASVTLIGVNLDALFADVAGKL